MLHSPLPALCQSLTYGTAPMASLPLGSSWKQSRERTTRDQSEDHEVRWLILLVSSFLGLHGLDVPSTQTTVSTGLSPLQPWPSCPVSSLATAGLLQCPVLVPLTLHTSWYTVPLFNSPKASCWVCHLSPTESLADTQTHPFDSKSLLRTEDIPTLCSTPKQSKVLLLYAFLSSPLHPFPL